MFTESDYEHILTSSTLVLFALITLANIPCVNKMSCVTLGTSEYTDIWYV